MNVFEMMNRTIGDERGQKFLTNVNVTWIEAESKFANNSYFENSKKYFVEALGKEYKCFTNDFNDVLYGIKDQMKLNAIFRNCVRNCKTSLELEDIDLYFDSMYNIFDELIERIYKIQFSKTFSNEMSLRNDESYSVKISLPQCRLLFF